MSLKRLSATALATTIVALALPAVASAAVSVSSSGGTVTITATNVNPTVTVNHRTSDFLISDAGGVTVGGGCDAPAGGQGRCDDSGITQITLTAQSAAGAVMNANAANVRSGVSILLQGGSGNDIFVSGHGNDTLHGGAGTDFLDGGSGTDVCNGDQNDSMVNCETTKVTYVW